jgi:DNA replication protein DnaC
MEANALLETNLRHLRLSTFKQNYAAFAEDASRNNLDHARCLLALAAVEITQRQQDRIACRIKAARFSALKEMADFEFSAIPRLDKAQVLFTFCSELNERVAMIVNTNLKFADWTRILGEEKLTAALLDRLTHHARILGLVGEPYRFRERMAKVVA